MERPRDSLGRPLTPGSPDRLGFDADALPSKRAERLELARELYDSRRFFEAHEVLERVWRDETDPAVRALWQGWLQLAVACCHAQRGNRPGAAALFARGCARLAEARPAAGFEPAGLARHGRAQAAAVRAGNDRQATAFLRLGRTGSR